MTNLLVGVLEGFLGEHRKLNEDTGQVSFDCPACSDDKDMLEGDGKGNLEINYDMGVFKCWACAEINDMHGPVMKLLKRYGNPKTIRDYLLVKPDADTIVDKERVEVIVTWPDGYKKLSECTPKDYGYLSAMAYLRNRGIGDDIIQEFDIGYTTTGKYYNRIIIPSYGHDGKLNYFISRWYSKEKNKLKYINPEAEKQEIVFNEKKINYDATIYVVEGAFDHVVVPNSTPLLGKYLSNKFMDLLQENAMGFVVFLLDADAVKDAIRLYKELNFDNLRGRVKICIPPEGYDPSLIYEKLGREGIAKLLRGSRFLTEEELY